ncbi:hypothetical protein HS1_000870 [Candidatus Desulfofervidus auxilii]|uniref:GIY-YIG domain-containing protein n=1 Tax=Desulfofervidus auxilii TaxID=1621989 RepID=A0A7U4THC0_DESA2|nr:hypothetical protein [Candidatus Desulfofervidus auxilii]AMM40674.1 hypothetical protein HS1_000870 [Candidatus Desulfofervidus auxilii]CAD7773935.1 hypothetical protein BLFGPEAP_01021 [Candidatus Methanoperedenaceae archaeon GB50]CAD7775230.1 hypothetical protein DMNBHIDG_01087 [Candidatus Methanoperedenaceae archaeon GB37]
MGNLIVNRIDLNNRRVVDKLRKVIDKLVQNSSCYYPLKFKPPYYFEVSTEQVPSESGWYIILEGKKPLYAGKADDLNKRLNIDNGSRDNFANTKRAFDPERNFIKKFAELNILSNLRVCVIKEKDVCSELNINPNDLNDLDRGNIEKLINIFRCYFNYQ